MAFEVGVSHIKQFKDVTNGFIDQKHKKSTA